MNNDEKMALINYWCPEGMVRKTTRGDYLVVLPMHGFFDSGTYVIDYNDAMRDAFYKVTQRVLDLCRAIENERHRQNHAN